MGTKKDIKSRVFIKLLKANGYELLRGNGSHRIYSNGTNKITITVPTINAMVMRRLIKENNLKEES